MKRFIAALFALTILGAQPALACDQEEAVAMMVKLVTGLGAKAGAAKTEEESLAVTQANARVNEAGEALAAGDFDKACEIYRAVAAQEGIALD
ncbi:MAG: hypothetical protein JNL25_05930 [Rhodospirillaceae bacterium]|nr:hypothetical protein [Rhodospirillaceae bacterium]